MEHLSPEERLLQLIRRRPKKEEPPSPVSAQPVSHLPKVHRKLQIPVGNGKVLSIFKKVNRVLGIALAVLGAIFCVTFVIGKVFPGASGSLKGQSLETLKTLGRTSPSEENSRKPYSYYAEEIEKRNIFGPSLYTETGQAPGEPALKESVKDLNLLGIVTGKTPQAIIEDKKEGKTFFVNKGDAIGLLRVEEILEDKVVLNYRGERVDLVL